jgi:hypothetical protein
MCNVQITGLEEFSVVSCERYEMSWGLTLPTNFVKTVYSTVTKEHGNLPFVKRFNMKYLQSNDLCVCVCVCVTSENFRIVSFDRCFPNLNVTHRVRV